MSQNAVDVIDDSSYLVMARRRSPEILLNPRPIQEGVACLTSTQYLLGERIVLLMLQGVLAVDAIVMRCDPRDDAHFSLELRYHGLSDALKTLLNQELLLSAVC